MPPAGRAVALAIFNLNGNSDKITSQENNHRHRTHGKWEIFDDPLPSTTRVAKRPRHAPALDENAEVSVQPISRIDHKTSKQSAKHEQGSGGFIVSQAGRVVKSEPADVDLLSPLHDVYEEISDDQIRDALAGLKNPTAKTKKSSAMPDRILYNRLKVIGFDLYPVEDGVNKYFPFSRYFFANRFGGSFVDTFPKPAAKMLAKHGLNDWAFLSLLYNPHAPQIPGAPGLFYVEDDASGTPYTKRVFVRLDDDKWLYVGHYRFEVAQSLTISEYQSLSQKVQSTWIERIAEGPRWAFEVLARIYLRSIKGAKEPSNEQVENVLSKNPSILKTITGEQVAEAYMSGQERLGVWSMKCIEYDTEWIAGLIEDYPDWKKQRMESRRQWGKKSKGASGNDKPKKSRNLKRKASVIDTASDTTSQESDAELNLTELELTDDDMK